MRGLITVVTLVAAGLLSGAAYYRLRSEIIARQQAIQSAWSEVDLAITLRADLVSALPSVAAARVAVKSARRPDERILANTRLDAAITGALATSQVAQEQRDEIAKADNRIAVARQRYNEAVSAFNVHIQLFPNNLAASIGGFTKHPVYFPVPEAGQAGN
jgi:LemA protein